MPMGAVVVLLCVDRGWKGALEAFDSRHQKYVCALENFEEFDARTGVG